MNMDFFKKRLDETRIKQLQSSNNNPMPNTGQMVRNFGQSVTRNLVSVSRGNELRVDEVEADKRLDICKGCEFFDSLSQRCSKCGCYLTVKTYLKAEHCPVNKW